MNWRSFIFLFLFLNTAWLAQDEWGSNRIAEGSEIPAFFTKNCIHCHDESSAEGDFRIDNIPTSMDDPSFGPRWHRAFERVNSGEMPPAEEPQPTAAERYEATEWIAQALIDFDSVQNSKQELVSYKRLTREEYVNTIEDLLGYTYHPSDPGGLPEDPHWMGIQRIGTVLSLTPSHIERYISAAESALSAVVPLSDPPKPWSWQWRATEVINWSGYRERLRRSPVTPRHRQLIGPGNNWKHYSGGLHEVRVPYTGQYRIRVTGSGLRPEGGSVPHVVLYNATIDRTLLAQDLDAPEDQPATIETTVWLPKGTHDLVLRNELPGRSPYDPDQRGGNVDIFTDLQSGRSPFLEKLTDNDFQPYVPLLILDRVEISAVVDPWPPQAEQELFSVEGNRDMEHAAAILGPFASRAFRREISEDDLNGLLQLFAEAERSGLSFERSIREVLLAILCSHEFLFLVEGGPDEGRSHLNDYELASRLSYFLWSTMPDAQLMEHAKAGRLREPEVLQAEFQRMIDDPRAKNFAYDFSRQWLHLKDVGKFPPDKNLYPDYDEGLKRSMVEESQAYFARTVAENLPIADLIDSDWSMLNNRMGRHYGIEGVADHHFRPVTLEPQHNRGGLLTQASVLTMTSDGFRHRPVHRGVWVSEVILGITPPPPPPNAGTLMPEAEGNAAKSLREQLESHRSVASCAACHAKIDPLGFAFENFDAIGRWRETDGDEPLDPSDTLADGRTFQNAQEFKQLLSEDIDQFAAALTERLANYALRRGLSFSDRVAIHQIVSEAQEDGLRTQDLVRRFVMSELFQTR